MHADMTPTRVRNVGSALHSALQARHHTATPMPDEGPKFGTNLTDEEKWALIEYMKSL
jgi:hypothetical protein